ncbi:ubiquitin-specific protease doa4 [Maudiozyma exigua]|uniref:Ubiquitin carboxyl-terminal hydrolase n=1 Tax=Maudiozyma exigua TaxID=34358 RepID=A0A9P6W896_MAUEX|nr:ubiquitin-specific protease doa4 [Kazachstania exigua]
MSTMKNDQIYCTSLVKLSEIAGEFISNSNAKKSTNTYDNTNDLKIVLQECIDTLANYKDECKKIKKLQLFNDPEIILTMKHDDKLQIFKIFESAYIFYKIIHITILVRIPNMKSFIKIKNEKDLHTVKQSENKEIIEIYNTLVNTLVQDDSIAKIKLFIKKNSKQRDEKEDRSEIANGSEISVLTLQSLIKTNKSDILLIDIRPRLEFNKCHILFNKIICIEPISFKDSYSDFELERKSLITSPNEEIKLFQKRDKFKYIVLYCDASSDTDSSFSKRKQLFLQNMLINKSFDKPLTYTKVVILKGGLQKWIESGGKTDTLTSIRDSNRDDVDDNSIYINGNTSRLNLQEFPKSTQVNNSEETTRSIQRMMSNSSSNSNPSAYSIHDQQLSKDGKQMKEPQRTSSFKRLFTNFRSSSGSSVTSGSNNHSTSSTAPPLSIHDLHTSNLYSPSSSSLAYPTQQVTSPLYESNESISYPDATSLLNNNMASMTLSGNSPSLSYSPARSNNIPIKKNSSPYSSPIAALHTRSQSFNETSNVRTGMLASISPLARSTNSPFSVDKQISPTNSGYSSMLSKRLPDIPRLPARPSSSSFSSSSPYTQQELLSGTTKSSLKHVQSYQKGIDLDFLTGLENMGNSCYLNCIIQCILGTHELTKIFLNDSYEKHINLNSKLGSKGVLAKNFARLVHTMHDNGTSGNDSSKKKKKIVPVRPQQFKFACGSVNSTFKDMCQQDCQEFCQFLLDGLHEDLNQCGGNPPLKELSKQAEESREKLSFRIASSIEWERYLTTDFSVIVDLFQGQYASRLQCKVCQHTSTTYQPFSVLSVPIPNKKNCNLLDCFKDFTKCEDLETDEQWSCPHCKKKQPSTKQLTITRLPRNLIIHLKRFDNRMNKNNNFINYPFTLDLTKFWPDDFDGNLPPGVTDELPARGQVAPFNYKLYGVACHFGSLQGGHYTAYVDKGVKNRWYYFDDTSYRPIKNHTEPITASAYVLFYHRIYNL